MGSLEKFPSINEWGAQITLAPKDTNAIVFRRGACKGLDTLILKGDHIILVLPLGDSLLWEKPKPL